MIRKFLQIRNGILFVSLLFLVNSSAFTDTIELQQGHNNYNGTQDVHIISWDGGQNQLERHKDGSNAGNRRSGSSHHDDPQNTGGWDYIEEGDYHTNPPLNEDSKCILIRFDLSGIKNVSSAKIGFYYMYERNDGNNEDFGDFLSSLTKPFFWFDSKKENRKKQTLHVNRILKKWVEGSGSRRSRTIDGSDAKDNGGEVTWNSTGFEFWQAMGAEGPEDIAPTESTTVFDPSTGKGWVWLDVTQSAKAWIADPSGNCGVKIGQEVYPLTPRKFLEPDLVLPDGKKIYSKNPVEKPTDFAPGAYDFISSDNTEHPDLRPKMVIEGEPVK